MTMLQKLFKYVILLMHIFNIDTLKLSYYRNNEVEIYEAMQTIVACISIIIRLS